MKILISVAIVVIGGKLIAPFFQVLNPWVQIAILLGLLWFWIDGFKPLKGPQ